MPTGQPTFNLSEFAGLVPVCYDGEPAYLSGEIDECGELGAATLWEVNETTSEWEQITPVAWGNVVHGECDRNYCTSDAIPASVSEGSDFASGGCGPFATLDEFLAACTAGCEVGYTPADPAATCTQGPIPTGVLAGHSFSIDGCGDYPSIAAAVEACLAGCETAHTPAAVVDSGETITSPTVTGSGPYATGELAYFDWPSSTGGFTVGDLSSVITLASGGTVQAQITAVDSKSATVPWRAAVHDLWVGAPVAPVHDFPGTPNIAVASSSGAEEFATISVALIYGGGATAADITTVAVDGEASNGPAGGERVDIVGDGDDWVAIAETGVFDWGGATGNLLDGQTALWQQTYLPTGAGWVGAKNVTTVDVTARIPGASGLLLGIATVDAAPGYIEIVCPSGEPVNIDYVDGAGQPATVDLTEGTCESAGQLTTACNELFPGFTYLDDLGAAQTFTPTQVPCEPAEPCGECVASTIKGFTNDPSEGIRKAYWNVRKDGTVTGPHIAALSLPGFYEDGCC